MLMYRIGWSASEVFLGLFLDRLSHSSLNSWKAVQALHERSAE